MFLSTEKVQVLLAKSTAFAVFKLHV